LQRNVFTDADRSLAKMLERPLDAIAFSTTPNAGMLRPVPSRLVVLGIAGPRMPAAKPCSRLASPAGNWADLRALKPPSKSVSCAAPSGVPPWKDMPIVVVSETKRSMITASMNTWRREWSSLSITRRMVA
jgi:hypothetical protein